MPAPSRRKGRRFVLRHRVMFGALGAGILVAVGIVVGVGVLLSGALSTSATVQHAPLTYRILETGLRYSVSSAAEEFVPPPGFDEPRRVAEGLACFRQHCAECHGAPGVAPESKALGMMPVPANLVPAGRNWDPAWLYRVTSEGIRMTGMPAWEFRLSQDELWSLVAFLKVLPTLDASEYRQAVDAAPEADCGFGGTPGSAALQGPVVLRQYGCHSCHEIEDVVGPATKVGPPLVDWPQRTYIAGVLPNTRANLVRWISEPQVVDPGTLMPDLGVPDEHAEIMANYLLTPR